MLLEDKEKEKVKSEKRCNELEGGEWTKYSISVWNDIRKTPEENKLHHPAIFPQMLVDRLIKCFTRDEDRIILDPFMGSGSTIVAAKALGKVGIGFELNQDYIKLAEDRLSALSLFGNSEYKIYNNDSKSIAQLIEKDSISLCVTSPPYWDILSQKRTADYKEIRNYGELNGDLSQIHDYYEFINQLGIIFKCVFDVLIPGKYCIVNVMDLRKKNNFYPFHSDLANKMIEIGYIYDDLIIWDRRQEYNNLRSLGYPYVFRLNKIHEYILIFQKPKI